MPSRGRFNQIAGGSYDSASAHVTASERADVELNRFSQLKPSELRNMHWVRPGASHGCPPSSELGEHSKRQWIVGTPVPRSAPLPQAPLMSKRPTLDAPDVRPRRGPGLKRFSENAALQGQGRAGSKRR